VLGIIPVRAAIAITRPTDSCPCGVLKHSSKSSGFLLDDLAAERATLMRPAASLARSSPTQSVSTIVAKFNAVWRNAAGLLRALVSFFGSVVSSVLISITPS
jgi:hypothetical protein